MEETRETTDIRGTPECTLAIGEAMIVDLVGVGGTFKTTYVGMIRPKLLIVKMPMAPEFRPHLFPGKQIMAKYLSEGTINVFRTSLAGVAFKPAPLLFMDYPPRIDSLRLRKSTRVVCRFPAMLQYGGASLPATITDLSLGGCQVAVTAKALGQSLPPAVDDLVLLDFAFLSLDYDVRAKARVKSVQGQPQLSLGLKFEDMGEEAKRALDGYFRIVAAAMPE